MNSLNANAAAISGDALPRWAGVTETLSFFIRLFCEVWPEDLPELSDSPCIGRVRRNLKPSEPLKLLGGQTGIG